jgi:hypothetical protein
MGKPLVESGMWFGHLCSKLWFWAQCMKNTSHLVSVQLYPSSYDLTQTVM